VRKVGRNGDLRAVLERRCRRQNSSTVDDGVERSRLIVDRDRGQRLDARVRRPGGGVDGAVIRQ
jgi:hypothetical protein